MKKSILVLPILALCLTGCGKEEKGQITCTNTQNNVASGYSIESKYVINYKGDNVESVDTVETVISDDESILSTFESQLDQIYKTTSETYGGYNYSVENKDGKVVSTVSIDYNKMDLDQYVKDQPSLKNFVKNGKIQVDGIKSIYEATGATCK